MAKANEAMVVLVTGVGGNVGQGVLRVLRALPHPLRIVGTNTTRVSAGNHLCDIAYEVPFSTAASYTSAMRRICTRESVSLIIPTTDLETVALSVDGLELPPVAVSPHDTCRLFLDKYLTAERFATLGIPFAASCLPSHYVDQWDRTIVKPRTGRGSRDIALDPPDPRTWNDEFVVQRRHEGPEITTSFYVDSAGAVVGFIVLERELEHGATSTCSVTHRYDEAVGGVVDTITAHHVIRGSCNVQAIADPDGSIVPFEVNCRISGTNAIRHWLGFPDVKYTVEEHLFGVQPSPVVVKDGSAMRILMDVIYPGVALSDVDAAATPHLVF